ncbi:MAG: nucleotidyl transferase AbiEii/AbiGii toxin family protein [Gammaproteobacteria bacterium]|nr:nucleotidyl transferase AbiEii/AbiGii toxin family protein [Gammaproteobacteria bacterium]
MADSPTDAQLALPDQQAALLRRALQWLNGIAAPNDCVLGGGTALAARWHHRLSVDIDLFTSAANYRRIKPALDLRAGKWKAYFGTSAKASVRGANGWRPQSSAQAQQE